MGLAAHDEGIGHQDDFLFDFNREDFPRWPELLYDSSGSNLAIFFSDSSGEQRNLTFVRNITGDISRENAQENYLQDILDTIQETFDLNYSQLANVCGLTRRTLYNWQKGSQPRQQTNERVKQLVRAAMDWQYSGFPKPGKSLDIPLVQDRSLYDLLKASTLNLEDIHFAGARLAMREKVGKKPHLIDPFS